MEFNKVPWHGTNYYMATVDVPTAKFFVTPSKSDLLIPKKTSEVARINKLAICVNGDGFIYFGNKVRPIGMAASNGKRYNSASRAENTMFINKKNLISFRRPNKPQNIFNAISFPNSLVSGSPFQYPQNDIAPRTIIGLVDEYMIFLVIDGIEGQIGATLNEAAELCVSLGFQTAINLDGGGSSTFCFNGALINVPSDDNVPGRERPVANHFGVRQ
jgi:exopolysaccharide biosynthesis protein